jgi:hypothetical protein
MGSVSVNGNGADFGDRGPSLTQVDPNEWHERIIPSRARDQVSLLRSAVAVEVFRRVRATPDQAWRRSERLRVGSARMAFPAFFCARRIS